jgi:hypothetical protein
VARVILHDTDIQGALASRRRKGAPKSRYCDFLLNPHRFGAGGPTIPSGFHVLMHFDGADGSTVFTEEHGKVVTRTGTGITIKTAQSKFGGASVGGFGAGNRLTTPVTGVSGEFAIGCWFYWDGLLPSANKALMTIGPNFELYIIATTHRVYFYNGASNLLQGVTAVVPNSWNFVCMERSGASTYLKLNGSVEASTATAVVVPTNTLYMGSYSDGSEVFSGYIDELFVKTNGNLYGSGAHALPTTAFNP